MNQQKLDKFRIRSIRKFQSNRLLAVRPNETIFNTSILSLYTYQLSASIDENRQLCVNEKANGNFSSSEYTLKNNKKYLLATKALSAVSIPKAEIRRKSLRNSSLPGPSGQSPCWGAVCLSLNLIQLFVQPYPLLSETQMTTTTTTFISIVDN